jgi:hypothetical protein
MDFLLCHYFYRYEEGRECVEIFWQKAHPIAGNNTKELPHMCKEQWTGHLHMHEVDGTDKIPRL